MYVGTVCETKGRARVESDLGRRTREPKLKVLPISARDEGRKGGEVKSGGRNPERGDKKRGVKGRKPNGVEIR